MHLLCQLLDVVSLLWRLIGSVVDPAALEPLHDVVVSHEEARHVLVSPAFEGDHLEGGEEVALALVVEPLTVFVDDDAVIVALDHRVGFRGPGVDELTVHAVERASGASADFETHPQTRTFVVLQARCDERELVRAPTNVPGQHLLIAYPNVSIAKKETTCETTDPRTRHKPERHLVR
jgi:hypothetical protein